MATETFDELRKAALAHLWMNSRQWNDMAADGGLTIIVEGDGVKVRDLEGREYYDGNSGAFLVNVGHGRKEIADAVHRQLTTLAYASTFIYPTIPSIKLAEKVASIAPGDLNRVFLTSGGSEAVETALKMARQYHILNGQSKRTKFIARRGSFHGVTMGALSVNGAPSVRRHLYEPMLPGVRHVGHVYCYRCPWGLAYPSCALTCAQEFERAIQFEGPDSVAAIIAEPVSVANGVAVPPDDYWPMVRAICDKYGVLLIADEVITGFGRTGKMFGMEHWGVVPDIMTTAKGITSGYWPVGAVIARDSVADTFKGGPEETFSHGFTYGGHPAGAAAALANIDIIQREGLVENSADMGQYMFDRLSALREYQSVGDVRGLGLMGAVELVKDKATKETLLNGAVNNKWLQNKLSELGLLVRVMEGCIYLVPPLTVTRSQVDDMVGILEQGICAAEREFRQS